MRKKKCKIAIDSLVPQLVRYRMRQSYSIVLIDTARLVRPTHSTDICDAQRGATGVRTNILSRHKYGDVMVLRIFIFLRIQRPLPSEEFFSPKKKKERQKSNARRLKDFNVASTDEPLNLFSYFSYLQKLSNVVVAISVTFKSWWASSSSRRIIFTTTTCTEFPIVGSLYSDDTMFIIVNK